MSQPVALTVAPINRLLEVRVTAVVRPVLPAGTHAAIAQFVPSAANKSVAGITVDFHLMIYFSIPLHEFTADPSADKHSTIPGYYVIRGNHTGTNQKAGQGLLNLGSSSNSLVIVFLSSYVSGSRASLFAYEALLVQPAWCTGVHHYRPTPSPWQCHSCGAARGFHVFAGDFGGVDAFEIVFDRLG